MRAASVPGPDPRDRTLFQLSFPLFVQARVMVAAMAIDMMIWSRHGPGTAAALSVAGQVMRVAVEVSAPSASPSGRRWRWPGRRCCA